jgi:hypothetical protein
LLEAEKIRFGNIGRFVGEHEFSLEGLPKLTQIDGKNNNTGGSSAAAKTTLLRTFDHNLGINATPTTVLQTRLAKEPAWTEGHYRWDGSPVTIYRSKGDLRVHGVDPRSGEEFSISGNVALAEEKIDQMMGLPRELFKKISHKEQGEPGFFLKMTAKEAYEFMLKCLGLTEWLAKMERAESDASRVRPDVQRLETILQTNRDYHARAVAALEAFERSPAPQAPDLSGLEEARQSLATAEQALDAVEAKRAKAAALVDAKKPTRPDLASPGEEMAALEAEISRTEAAVRAAEGEHKKKLDQFRAAIRELNAQLTAHRGAAHARSKEIDALQRLSAERPRVEAELRTHAENRCPTCRQHWETPESQRHGAMLKAKLAEIDAAERAIIYVMEQQEKNNEDARAVEAKLTTAQALESKLADQDPAMPLRAALNDPGGLRNRHGKLRYDLEQLNKALLAQYDVQLQEWEALRKKVQSALDAEASGLREQVRQLRMKINALESDQNRYLASAGAWEMEIKFKREDAARNEKAAEKAENDLANAKAELALYEDAKRLIKQYTMGKFEEALEQIGRKATETVNRIPNMATATISFEPFKEVKGKIKDEIVALISMDGEEAVPLKSLCGGENSAADSAVDLAVIDLIEERSGIGVNYYIMDEPCGGMDDVCKAEFMEMIKASESRKRIFIVEHSPAIKELAEATITVERTGPYSKVVAT